MPSRKQSQRVPSVKERFATNLTVARKRKFETAKACADALGIGDERYRMWERATNEPDIEHLARLASLLDVSLDFLILSDLPSLKTRGPGR